MFKQAYQKDIDEDVLNASPLKFVLLLYRGALDSIASARRYLRLGDVRARSRAIGKAMLIVTELSLSLNKKEGLELSRNLAALYAYVETLLIKANFEQCDAPLEEAERLLAILVEAWETCAQPATPAPAPSQPETHQSVSCAY
jgi:flagellar protein FliS